MSVTIRRRVERLEQFAPEIKATVDFRGLTDTGFEVYRSVITALQATAITPKEAADLCALANGGVPFPYPLKCEPSFIHPPHLRVLSGGEVRYRRWHGWPGYRPLGWERYLIVAPDGELRRTDRIAPKTPS